MSDPTQQFCDAVRTFLARNGSCTLGNLGSQKELSKLWQQLKKGKPHAKMMQVLTSNNVQGWTTDKRKGGKDNDGPKKSKKARIESRAANPFGTTKFPLSTRLESLTMMWNDVFQDCQLQFQNMQQQRDSLEAQRKELESQTEQVMKLREELLPEKAKWHELLQAKSLEQQRAEMVAAKQDLEQKQQQFEEERNKLKLDRQGCVVTWAFEDDAAWKAFSPDHCGQLTKAFDAGESSLVLQRPSFTYDVNLQSLTQVNQQTGKRRSIRRQKMPLPNHIPSGPVEVCAHLVASASPGRRMSITPEALVKGSLEEVLYCRAEAYFHRMRRQSSPSIVARIEFIANEAVAQRYESAKAGMAASGQADEYGFHGTALSIIEGIVSEGFKVGGMGVPIRNGSAGGQGVYIARHPDLSFNFAQGCNCLLVCRVLTAGARAHGDAWVLANPDHVYPEFIVHYT